MPLQIIRADITQVKADAIVNTANPEPTFAGGTDQAIYQAAGKEELLAARRKIGPIARGEAAVTPAFALPAKYIIHTVGPSWMDGQQGEFEVLASCYRNSLKVAQELSCESIAFPLIATGVYGFPKDAALKTAVSEISGFLMESEMQVFLVVFGKKAYELSGRIFADVDSYIDETYVTAKMEEEYKTNLYGSLRRRGESRWLRKEERPESVKAVERSPGAMSAHSLEEAVQGMGETFQQKLFHLIDERGLTDVEVYKKANLTRQHFSKIRSNEHYVPHKNTVLALAVSLHLSLPETEDLLKGAGMAFADGNLFDVIVQYFISQGDYNIYEINEELFKYGEQQLGAQGG